MTLRKTNLLCSNIDASCDWKKKLLLATNKSNVTKKETKKRNDTFCECKKNIATYVPNTQESQEWTFDDMLTKDKQIKKDVMKLNEVEKNTK